MVSFIFFQDLNMPPFPESPSPTRTVSFTQPPNLDTNLETFHESMPDPRFSSPLDSTSGTIMENSRLSASQRNIVLSPLNSIPGGDLLEDLLVKEQNYLSTRMEGSRWIHNRSSELVMINNRTPEERRSSREDVRRTRMTFESLRILVSFEEDERIRQSFETHRHINADLDAGQTMRMKGLWQNRDQRVVGLIPGVEIGDVFFNRMELCVLGLHGQIQAGIDFVPASPVIKNPIATSILVSEGYKDNQDHGDIIIYTGQSRKKYRSKKDSNQVMNGGNLALLTSLHYGVKIRVIRGFENPESKTNHIYVYDGLYSITKYWEDIGKSGFKVYKFQLIRDGNEGPTGSRVLKLAESIRDAPLSARRVLSPDISLGKEGFFRINRLNDFFNEVTLFNDIDSDDGPMYYKYISTPIAYSQNHRQDVDDDYGCGCVTGCFDGCACSWKNGGEYPYDIHGVLIRGKPLIYECGSSCMCPETCRNRVSQGNISHNNLKKRFEVFKSVETGGWGVRSLDLIRPGHFICEYAGLVMTREEARLVTIDRDVMSIDGNLFGDKWKEWGDLSNVRENYATPTYPPSPPTDYMINLTEFRNMACYMRHGNSSVVANVMVQKVVYKDDNYFYPHFILFAMENIPPMRELILDYVTV